jgi:hypothetical protein
MNPARGGVVGMLTAGFKPDPLMKTVPVVGGALGNAVLSGMVGNFMPAMLQTGPGNLVLGLGTAGLLGAASGLVLSPRQAGSVFLGGVIEVVTRGVRQYLLPTLSGISGLGDYLTRQNAADARALGCVGPNCPNPMGDYALSMQTGSYLPDFSQATGLDNSGVPSYAQATDLNPYSYGMQGLGDYLTPANASNARPLGALLYNDRPVEGAIREELDFGF